jgi:hypothetical protein
MKRNNVVCPEHFALTSGDCIVYSLVPVTSGLHRSIIVLAELYVVIVIRIILKIPLCTLVKIVVIRQNVVGCS